jgi:hypothetical protein
MNSPSANFLEQLSSSDRVTGANEAALYAPTVAELYRTVQGSRADVVSKGEATMVLWREAIQNEGFRAAVDNLAHYLALRQRDLSAT